MQQNTESLTNRIMNTPYLCNEFLRYVELALKITDESIIEAKKRNKEIYKYALMYSPQYAYLFKDNYKYDN